MSHRAPPPSRLKSTGTRAHRPQPIPQRSTASNAAEDESHGQLGSSKSASGAEAAKLRRAHCLGPTGLFLAARSTISRGAGYGDVGRHNHMGSFSPADDFLPGTSVVSSRDLEDTETKRQMGFEVAAEAAHGR